MKLSSFLFVHWSFGYLRTFLEQNKTKISTNRNREKKANLRGEMGEACMVGLFT